MYIGTDFPFLVCLILYSGALSGDYYPLRKLQFFLMQFF